MRQPPPYTALPRYPVTGGTILLAIGVTLAWQLGKVDVSALQTSALIQRGQAWRLLTATLPHVGLWHLLFNCYWTWAFGTLLEGAWGPLATAGTFALLGAGSMAAEFAVLDGGVGLSGVGYGLFGLLWVLGRRDVRFAGAVDRWTAFTFLAWFVGCIVATYAGVTAVANVAHGAGLVLGLGLGAAAGGVATGAGRIASGLGVALLAVVFLAGATVLRPLINRSPSAAADNAYQGWRALDDHRDADAVRWLSDAVRMGPGVAGAWYNLGVAQMRVGRPGEATAAFKQAHTLDPEDAGYREAAERSGDGG